MKETKEEIIGVVFSKLKPKKSETFADIGCGSGAVSKFFSSYVSKIYAVEKDEGAFKIALSNLKNVENVEVIFSDGYDFLKEKSVDIAFFGGTKGIEKMLEVCKASRIVVNAARLEVAGRVIQKMKEIGVFKEALIVNISKSYDLAGGTAFKSMNPVFVILGVRE